MTAVFATKISAFDPENISQRVLLTKERLYAIDQLNGEGRQQSFAAALLLIFPKTDEGASFIDGWSWLLFGICFAGSVRKLNPILLILFSAVAGIAIYYVPTVV